jgi:hypothetical protein
VRLIACVDGIVQSRVTRLMVRCLNPTRLSYCSGSSGSTWIARGRRVFNDDVENEEVK